MMPRHVRNGLGLGALLLGVVAAAGIEPAPTGAPRAEDAWDRRSDLAGLRTLLAFGSGDCLTTSECGEFQAQLDRLVGDENAELDQRRRAKLHRKLRELQGHGKSDVNLAW